MLSLELDVFFLTDGNSADIVTLDEHPTDQLTVRYHICKDEAELSLPTDGYAVAITDRLPLPRAIYDHKTPQTYVIYYGRPEAVEADPETGLEYFDDIWIPGENEAFCAYKFKKMLIGKLNEYQNYLYREYGRVLMDSIPDMVWFKEVNGLHHAVNRVFSEIVEKPKEDCEGRDHYYIWNVPADDLTAGAACEESENQVIAKRKTCTFEEPVRTPEGMRTFRTYKSPLFDPFGKILGTVGMGHDVTNLKDMDIELRTLIENIPFPMAICAPDHSIIRVNEHFLDYFDMTREQAQAIPYQRWVEETFVPIDKIPVVDNTGATQQEFRYIIDEDEERIFNLIEKEITDSFENGSGYFCLFNDITFQRTYENMIVEAINTDTLTGLNSRRYFYDTARKRENEALTILYMDLDHFKEVNDIYGHDKGDEVLKDAAYIIRKCLPDAFIGRVGGDEFAALLFGEQDSIDLANKMESITDGFAEKFGNMEIPVGISIGMAAKNAGAGDINSIIRLSDENMYETKKQHHGER